MHTIYRSVLQHGGWGGLSVKNTVAVLCQIHGCVFVIVGVQYLCELCDCDVYLWFRVCILCERCDCDVYLWLKVSILCEWCECDVYLWLKLYILCEQCNCDTSVCSWRCWFHVSGVVVIEAVDFMWAYVIEDVNFMWVVWFINCDCRCWCYITVWLWLNMLILHERCGHDRRCWFYMSGAVMTEDADFTWAVWSR